MNSKKINIWDNLPHPFLILAPMEGVTDTLFRQVVASAGMVGEMTQAWMIFLICAIVAVAVFLVIMTL